MNEQWKITVGGGYGSFIFTGTEDEAEKMRKHKARWEGAVARKERILTNEPSVNESKLETSHH